MLTIKKQKWIILSDGARPTEDIYFLKSVAPYLKEGHSICRLNTKLFPTSIISIIKRKIYGSNILIFRTLSAEWLAFLKENKTLIRSIHYVIDDDIAAAKNDHCLPENYRHRMTRSAKLIPEIISLADNVITCNKYLTALFSTYHHQVHTLTPPLIYPLPNLSHFEQSFWRIGYYGTGIHRHDFETIIPALLELNNSHPSLQFECMLGNNIPKTFSALKNVNALKPKSWNRFKKYQQKNRIHIGLAPLMDTPFNKGKSYIKFLDISAMGGVGVYSNRAPYNSIIDHGKNGLLAEDTCESWYRCLMQLISNQDQTLKMAENAAKLAAAIGDTSLTKNFWLRL